MTVKEALVAGGHQLLSAGIAEAPLESELLLRHILTTSVAGLYLRHNDPLPPEQEHAYFSLLERRLSGEPCAYIIGKREFYGLEFDVNPAVLIPRPETEILVDRILAIAAEYREPTVADIGTGSGAIAITTAKHLLHAKFYAIDLSREALDTARHNADRHAVADTITFLQGDLLAPLPEAVDILVANLPYVPSGSLPKTGEPTLALDGGGNGLDVIARLIQGLPDKLKPGAKVLLEIGWGQEAEAHRLLSLALPTAIMQTYNDLAGIPRIIQATCQ